MKVFYYFLLILALLVRPVLSNELSTKLSQLNDYLQKGLISQSDYNDAKDALIKLDKIKNKREKAEKAVLNKNNSSKKEFKIGKFKKQTKGSQEFEKMEMKFTDYRIYTHRPGAMKIKRISDGKQLAVIGDDLKIKYYNNSKDFIKFENATETKSVLRVNNIPVLTWDFRHVKKHQANFYQVLALGTKPFHYYIVLYQKNRIVALNYSKFERQIQKAIDEAKVRLASTHNVSIEQIDALMKKREEKAFSELQKIIGEKKDQVLEASINETVESELQKQLDAALGAALASEFNVALEQATGQAMDQAIESELAAAIDETIAEAISMGISEAAIAAGIAAALAVLAAGGTEDEAIAAGEAACGC